MLHSASTRSGQGGTSSWRHLVLRVPLPAADYRSHDTALKRYMPSSVARFSSSITRRKSIGRHGARRSNSLIAIARSASGSQPSTAAGSVTLTYRAGFMRAELPGATSSSPPTAANRYSLSEWAGAFGDLGTLVPFVVAYLAV